MNKYTTPAPQQAKTASAQLANLDRVIQKFKYGRTKMDPEVLKILETLTDATGLLACAVENIIIDYEQFQ